MYSSLPQLLNILNVNVNSSRPRQNRRHFADDVFKCNFFNGNVWIPIGISLKFVHKGPINNVPALVQIMAWRRTGDKPLSEPMMTQFNDAYMRHSTSMSEKPTLSSTHLGYRQMVGGEEDHSVFHNHYAIHDSCIRTTILFVKPKKVRFTTTNTVIEC